jgi:cytochrome c oxidase subunit 1
MNPWGGNSLEWHTSSPPPHDNFAVTPVAEDPYDYDRLDPDPVHGGYTSRTYEGAKA